MPAASSAASLIIQVVIDAGRAGSDLDSLAARFSKIGEGLTGVAAKVLGGAALAGFASGAIQAASDLQESVGGLSAVFKENAGDVRSWADDAQDSIRLPAATAEKYATILGSLLKNAGTPMDQLSDKTHNLLQLAADLASTYGTTTERAAHALTSALKGNFNMLDEYGINITAAEVRTQSLAESQLTGADAASQAAKSQATLSLIYKLGADSAGMAEKESGNYAAAVERLNESWTNFLAAVGGQALGGATDFLNFLTRGIQLIQPFVVSLAGLVSGLTNLPGPIIAIGVAFGAWLAVGPAVVGSLSSMFGAISTFYMQAKMLQSGVVGAGGAMSTFGALVRTGASGAGAALKGLWAAMGGLPGLIFMAAAALAVAGLMKWMDAAERARKIANEAKQAVEAFQQTLRSGGDVRVTGYDNLADMLKDLDTGYGTVGEAAEAAGLSVEEMVSAVTGGGPAATLAIDTINAKIKELQGNTVRKGGGRSGVTVIAEDSQKAIAQLELVRDGIEAQAPALNNAAKAEAERNKLKQQGVEITDAASAATLKEKDANDALKEALEGAKKAAESTLANSFLNQISDEANRAKRDAEIFLAVMDTSLGRSRAYEQNTLGWADGIRNVGTAFKDAAEKSELNKAALTEWDIGALASTESGSKLASSLLAQSDQFSKFVTAAFEASGGVDDMNTSLGAAHVAADQGYSDFVNMAKGMGLSTEEAQTLAQKLGIVNASEIDDKIFEIIAEDQKALMTAKLWETVTFDEKEVKFKAAFPAAQALADEMNTKYGLITPAPINVPTTVGTPTNPPPGAFGQAIMSEQARIGGLVTVPTAVAPPTSVPGGAVAAAAMTGAAQTTPQVTVPVQQTGAEQAASQITTAANAAGSKPIVISVSANTNSAITIIGALMGVTRLITVNVTANTGAANSAINSFMGVNRVIKFETFVNIGPAISLILSFMNVARTITFQTVANTGTAASQINGIVTGHYTATVTIGANTTEFYKAWNALPTTRSIDVIVNQRQGTVVAPPAPSSFAAPQLFGAVVPSNQASSGSNVTYNINVTGGMSDPDGAARAIAKVLRDRDRRSTTVYAQ